MKTIFQIVALLLLNANVHAQMSCTDIAPHFVTAYDYNLAFVKGVRASDAICKGYGVNTAAYAQCMLPSVQLLAQSSTVLESWDNALRNGCKMTISGSPSLPPEIRAYCTDIDRNFNLAYDYNLAFIRGVRSADTICKGYGSGTVAYSQCMQPSINLLAQSSQVLESWDAARGRPYVCLINLVNK